MTHMDVLVTGQIVHQAHQQTTLPRSGAAVGSDRAAEVAYPDIPGRDHDPERGACMHGHRESSMCDIHERGACMDIHDLLGS